MPKAYPSRILAEAGRAHRHVDGRRGPNGLPLCRWCDLEILAKRRRTFCSDFCVHQWRLRSDPGYLRSITSRRSLWDADHILPVAEGGGQCDLANIRTLCLLCHRDETARLRARLHASRALLRQTSG